MSENRKCLTFIWKIKNFNFCSGNSGIHSPVFFAHILGGTKWSICLCPDDRNFPGCVTCYIRRENDDSGPHLIQLDYELSLLAVNGSVLYSEIFLKKLYRTFNTDWKTALQVKKDEVFLHRKDLFMPDTLTIRCRMWDSQNSISQSESCFVETSIRTQCKSFVGTIKKFRCLEPWEVYPICIISSKENFLSSMNLCVVADDKLVIEMVVSRKFFRPYRYKIFIRDIFGSKVKYGQGECHESKLRCFPLTLSKEHLMENKRYYFPKNMLTIECEIISSKGKHIAKNVELEYGFDFQETQECISNAMETNLSSKEYYSESFATLKDDLNSLFREGVLCDTELKTATETFPVHIAVLSARSSVFKSMFTNDMKKKTKKCVVIDDLDDDTVSRMLKFMYLDTLDDLEYESAQSMYLEAVKFNIVSLRHRCSNFLKQYILLKNCCDMLFLADKHQDKDLKNAVQDYIAKNDKVVLFSDEWKNLEKNHPQLTIEALRAVYMKNQRSLDNT